VRLVEEGVGRNMITSRISLDDEDKDGCTVVVKGMHRNLGEWVKEVGKDGIQLPRGGATSSLDKY